MLGGSFVLFCLFSFVEPANSTCTGQRKTALPELAPALCQTKYRSLAWKQGSKGRPHPFGSVWEPRCLGDPGQIPASPAGHKALPAGRSPAREGWGGRLLKGWGDRGAAAAVWVLTVAMAPNLSVLCALVLALCAPSPSRAATGVRGAAGVRAPQSRASEARVSAQAPRGSPSNCLL